MVCILKKKERKNMDEMIMMLNDDEKIGQLTFISDEKEKGEIKGGHRI